jgi:flagellar L-ring protein precursor FlgH
MTRWLLVLPVAAGAAAPAVADSIWDRRDPRYAFLFQDNRARQIGDVLTVNVTENTVATENETRALDKGNNASGNVQFSGSSSAGSGGGAGGGGGGGRTGALSFNLTDAFRRRFNGTAQFTAGRLFTDRIAVTVVDVMPNGNLVIEGYRTRVVAGEERVLRLTGVVRQQDVGLGNAVASAAIANLRISYLGRGPASRSVNQNYFGRVMNLLWPF